MRVQIPAWSDSWMKGDRYGEIVKITKTRGSTRRDGAHGPDREIARVRMDISGKILKFLLDDCTEVA